MNNVSCGDCIPLMAKMEAGSVALAFADPPFNIGYDYDVYDDRRGCEDYLAWSQRWIEGVKRVLKPDGAFWLAIGDEYAAELKVLCTKDLGLHVRSWVIWFYTFGVNCKNKFTRSHAHLFHFVKDPKRFTFNSLDVRVPSARELVYGDKRADPKGRLPDDTWMMSPILPPDVPTRDGFVLRPQDIPARFPPDSDTWYFSRVAGTFAERRGWHGCQMPEQLLGRIIKACSNKGDVVLDPFGGSGTTLAVAKKLERQFIGIELSKEYTKSIRERLASINPGDALIGPENAALSAPKTKAGRKLRRAMPPEKEAVSRSPVMAKTNVSLGQIAVANGEFATAVAEAFLASHQGYSADRVLADPVLNDKFLENCRLLGISGAPGDWNRLLLKVRKRGGLTAIDTSRRTTLRQNQMEPFLHASEIAWRKVGGDAECSLDDVLCDPALAEHFDTIASRIAPGFSPFQYRWGALSVRKEASRGNAILNQVSNELGCLAPGARPLSETDRLPPGPGHYFITAAETPFFVGYADSLRKCPLFEPDRLAAAMKAFGHDVVNEEDIRIRTRIFDYAALRRIASEFKPVNWKAARRARLVKRHEPIGNTPLANSAA